MIPDGSTPWNLGFYEYMKNFAFYVVHNQEYLIENPKIVIMNGIDKVLAKQTLKTSEWFANQLAVKLKKYAFNVIDVQNFTQPISWTTLYVISTGEVSHTIQTLKNFVPILTVVKSGFGSWFDQLSGVDLVLVLGNDYLSSLAMHPFNYDK
jgi:hypothetical protein